jgi:pyruvate/2-oxoglutarate dehydrogenase complex dihydrolipoamide acyltransferase (E2) component
LEKSVLKAPFAGTVAARLMDEGTVIMAGQTVLRLVEDTHLEARVGVPPHVAAHCQLAVSSASRSARRSIQPAWRRCCQRSRAARAP